MAYQNKTVPTSNSVKDFLISYPNPKLTNDYLELCELITRITNKKPVLWGRIVGFGKYHYKYESGTEGDAIITGFAPSKVGMTIYIMDGSQEMLDLTSKLGKYKLGKSCLYIKRLSEIDLNILEQMIKRGIDFISTKYEVLE